MELVYEKSIQYINWRCCKSQQIYTLDSDLATKTMIVNVFWFTSLQPLEKPPYSLEITTDFYARDALHSSEDSGWETIRELLRRPQGHLLKEWKPFCQARGKDYRFWWFRVREILLKSHRRYWKQTKILLQPSGFPIKYRLQGGAIIKWVSVWVCELLQKS